MSTWLGDSSNRKGESVESCENCGAPIGNLETPHVWRGEKVVCERCYVKLSSTPPISPTPSPAASGAEGAGTQQAQSQTSADTIRCPKCGSAQISANKQGFSARKSCLGFLLGCGIVSVLCGFMGSRKMLITCLACGYQWQPGEPSPRLKIGQSLGISKILGALRRKGK